MNALIQGASGGIGLALLRALLDSGCDRVFATYRRDRESLGKYAHDERVYLIRLDLEDERSIVEASQAVAEKSKTLDLLINASGLLHDGDLQPERRLEHLASDSLARAFAVNATGPALMAKHFYPLLNHGGRAVFASLSARVGSIGDNRLGGWYAYRASKAAQNMITKTLALEMERRAPQLILVALHPGTVNTELSKPFQRNVPPEKLFSADRAAAQLLRVIDGLEVGHSGSFLDWQGLPIEW